MAEENAESSRAEQFADRLTAIASPQRLRIIAELTGGELHVSELARRVGMSRALLYMHLKKIEAAGFVSGRLELGEDGTAVKIYSVEPFTVEVTPRVIADVVLEDSKGK